MSIENTYLPVDHQPIVNGKIGVLLVNLGTPETTSYWSVRSFLREFLSDSRVVELSPLLWWPILHGLVLTFRPGRSAKSYKAIWDNDKNQSPLRVITQSQAEKLQERFIKKKKENIIVSWAMRYGTPSLEKQIQQLKDNGCGHILISPLYPQYSATTTASVFDEVANALKKMRWQPTLRFLPPYYGETCYIDTLAQSIETQLQTLDFNPDVIVASYHGLPKKYIDKGDPYYCHCHKTTRLLREKLGLSDEQLVMTFQSRFGPKQWLQPYTLEYIEKLARKGIRKVAVVTPGFSADCLETLEEIAMGGSEIFKKTGGSHFTTFSCLNDSELSLSMLEQLINQELKGWK